MLITTQIPPVSRPACTSRALVFSVLLSNETSFLSKPNELNQSISLCIPFMSRLQCVSGSRENDPVILSIMNVLVANSTCPPKHINSGLSIEW